MKVMKKIVLIVGVGCCNLALARVIPPAPVLIAPVVANQSAVVPNNAPQVGLSQQNINSQINRSSAPSSTSTSETKDTPGSSTNVLAKQPKAPTVVRVAPRIIPKAPGAVGASVQSPVKVPLVPTGAKQTKSIGRFGIPFPTGVGSVREVPSRINDNRASFTQPEPLSAAVKK